ncbi:MAG: hypothetical protein F6K39_43195, partial [Okeania sp. SIO3B3]|nr:hypothetical protein [Okeania sp. SIO3B3]
GGKAAMLEAGGRRKEKVRREKVFLSRYYPDMILGIKVCLKSIPLLLISNFDYSL